MIELLRAVKAVTECGGIDLEFDWSPMSNLSHALSAYVAEIRRRRAESPWQGPFHVSQWSAEHGIAVLNNNGGIVSNLLPDDGANVMCAALNAYYGYDAQGKDMLEGMEP